MEKVNWKIVVTAIIALCLIECTALINGIDGILMSFMIAAIAGLAGLSMPQPKLILQKVTK